MPAHRHTDVSFSSALLSWVYLQSSLTKMQTYGEDRSYIVHTSNYPQDQDVSLKDQQLQAAKNKK